MGASPSWIRESSRYVSKVRLPFGSVQPDHHAPRRSASRRIGPYAGEVARRKPDSGGQLGLLLLAVLSSGPAHGYAVVTALRERSGGSFDLPEGSVYPALHQFEEQGLVVSRWEDAGGRRRRVYQLTSAGLDQLIERQRSWRTFSASIDAVIGWTP
jgi:PadR family transcriptional regulator PadR